MSGETVINKSVMERGKHTFVLSTLFIGDTYSYKTTIVFDGHTTLAEICSDDIKGAMANFQVWHKMIHNNSIPQILKIFQAFNEEE